jgi:hypothetical protein
MQHFGLFCDACSSVTVFEDDALYPRSCAHCDTVLRAAPPPDKMRARRRDRERAARMVRERREQRAARSAA